MLPWLAALGATSVQASYNDVYTSMDTGVIDGYSMPANVVTAFKIYEVGKYFTKCGLAGADVCGILNINISKWESLPKEVQDIMVEWEMNFHGTSTNAMWRHWEKPRKSWKKTG